MNTFTKPSGRSPTELVLWAAARLAHDFELPKREDVWSLPHHSLQTVNANSLADAYGAIARNNLEFSRGWRDSHSADLAVALSRRSIAVTTIMWPIREQALQAADTAPVEVDAWHLLVMIGTVLYVRGKHGDLIEWVTRVAGDIGDVIVTSDSDLEEE